MKYKPDIERTLENFRMWWNREDFGRCAIAIYVRKPDSPDDPPVPLPAKIEDRWLDFDYLKAAEDHRMRNHEYIAEALPVWSGGYPGHDGVCTWLGCGIRFGRETAWGSPIMAEGSLEDYDPDALSIKDDNKWWLFSQKFHAFINECSEGKSLPTLPAMGGTADSLTGLRTTNKLLLDVIDTPEAVKRFEKRMMEIWIEKYEYFYNLHRDRAYGGCVHFMNMWAPGRCYVPHNDFSYMISTKMYEELFLEQLLKQLAYLDYSIYHVDGIGAFRHVDMLCSLKDLNALQILPGAGKPSPLHYMDILKKVQAAGKNLHIGIPPEEVGDALDSLSSKGLFINTYCDTVDEGYALLKLTEKRSRFI